VDVAGPVPTPGLFRHVGVLIAFNGEVYNWRALRNELADGTHWETQCDTEVVAHAWRRWGVGMLDHLNGMFSFALVDLWQNVVLLARDRAGEKPLYYSSHEGALFFASEVKAIGSPLVEGPPPAEVDVLEFDCLSDTPFQGIHRLGPGQYLLLQEPSDLQHPKPTTWWRFPSDIDTGMTFDQAVDETEALVVDAIRLRGQGLEVPTTALVSGGLDSAIIQAVLRLPQVFCCTFPQDNMDWIPQAQMASKGAEVVPVTFGLEDALRDLNLVAYHLDTPATWTALSQWFLAKEMKARGFKVVLSGEGADELFAGYSRYRILWWLSQARWDPQLTTYQMLIDLMTAGSDTDILTKMLDRSPKNRSYAQAKALVLEFAATGDLVADMFRVEWHTTMQCLLRMADRMMAAHSMENRSPFLDHRLVELAARMPTRHKITATRSKAVLREVALRVGVDPRIVNDPTKVGFVVPWNKWRGPMAQGGNRGAWDRGDFARTLQAAWRSSFKLEVP
jgi:asparagine synthase (glutamine-hydrolysing)